MLVDVVGVALKRPYTFVVMALLMLVLGPLAELAMRGFGAVIEPFVPLLGQRYQRLQISLIQQQ